MTGPRQLSIGALVRRGLDVHGTAAVRTYDGERVTEASYTEVAERAGRLAQALGERGVAPGIAVGACCWNTQAFLEVFLAVPGVGGLVHTINPRLSADQLDFVMAHAGERLVICDASLLGTLTAADRALALVNEVIVIGAAEAPALDAVRAAGCAVTDYEDLLAQTAGGYDWPDLDEELPATLCYTTGTTGDPKGAVYTQRAIVLHSLAECAVDALAVSKADRVLLVSPMFHVNGWGLPYTAWLAGADMVMPGRYLQAPHLARLLRVEHPTFMTGVPTIYNDLRRHESTPDGALDLSGLRTAMCGGSPVPRALIQHFRDHHGVALTQAWGMTENGLLSVAVPPDGAVGEAELDWREKTGCLVAGVEARVVDDRDDVLPNDGVAVGEIELRGWWVIGSYYRGDGSDRFHDGWLRTGDVGTLTRDGWVQITDRAKDVIKSGGEWISSIDLEAAILAHPGVHEVAVIAVPDERWFERPLACVVLRDDATAQVVDLCAHLDGRVARWWLPERWAFMPEVPKTSVGKFDKKLLRARFAAGELDVRSVTAATAST